MKDFLLAVTEGFLFVHLVALMLALTIVDAHCIYRYVRNELARQ